MSKKRKVQEAQKQSVNKKQLVTTILAMVMVAVVAVMGTLAYLNQKSNTKDNVFLGSPGIGLTLDEPNYEESKAQDYTPGMTIVKDPVLTNTSTADDTSKTKEWVAIKVSYQVYGATAINGVTSGNAIQYSKLKKIIKEISFNTTNWTLIKGGTDSDTYAIYMYNTELAKDATTNALFQKIEILDQDTLATNGYDPNSTTGLPGFDIVLAGAAVKNETGKTKFSDVDAGTGTNQQSNIKDALITLLG